MLERASSLVCSRSTSFLREVTWLDGAPPAQPIEVNVKIRYRHAGERAWVIPGELGAQVRLAAPVRGVSVGQAAVFYEGDAVVGGGRIAYA